MTLGHPPRLTEELETGYSVTPLAGGRGRSGRWEADDEVGEPPGCSSCGASSPGRWVSSPSVTRRWCGPSGLEGGHRRVSRPRLRRRNKRPCPAKSAVDPIPKSLQKGGLRCWRRSAKPLQNVDFWKNGRSGRIRTCDPCVPNVARGGRSPTGSLIVVCIPAGPRPASSRLTRNWLRARLFSLIPRC